MIQKKAVPVVEFALVGIEVERFAVVAAVAVAVELVSGLKWVAAVVPVTGLVEQNRLGYPDVETQLVSLLVKVAYRFE